MKNIVFVEASTTGAGELAIAHANQAGLRTTLMTQRPQAYSANYCAHEVVVCDTNEMEAAKKALLDLNQRTPVHAVTTTADLHVPCAAYLASLLGLPSLTLQAATRVRNKHAMRVHLGTHYPAANPRFSLVQSISEVAGAVDSVGLPLVAKPPNGDGSDDVQIHHGMETLESHVRDTYWHADLTREGNRWVPACYLSSTSKEMSLALRRSPYRVAHPS